MTLTMSQYGVIVMPEHKAYVKSESKVQSTKSYGERRA